MKTTCPKCDPLQHVPLRLRPFCGYCAFVHAMNRSTEDAMQRLGAMADLVTRRRQRRDTLH